MAITHAKVKSTPDGTDETVVRPSDWNAEHVISITSATVDFGTTPVYNKSFTVVDADCTTSNKVFICGTAATDEAEFDAITYAAKANNGTITVYANAQPGPVSGARTFYYFLGE